MDLRFERERAGLSVKELAARSGLSVGTLARSESGRRVLKPGEVRSLEVALGLVVSSSVPAVSGGGGRGRWVFWCPECKSRVFFGVEPEERLVPVCERHGRFVRQLNVPYEGRVSGHRETCQCLECREGRDRLTRVASGLSA